MGNVEVGDMGELIPIGRFSRMTRLSVKALRHYQDVGLLEPALVDESSGYRYYRFSQAIRAETIRILRSVDMPIGEIREVLGAGDTDLALKHLEAHRERLLERLADQTRMLTYLERLIAQEGRIVPYEIKVKEVPDQHVIATRFHTSLATVATDFQQAFGRLGAFGIPPIGAPFAVLHDVIDEETDGDIEICFPVAAPVEAEGDVFGREVEAARVASTMHIGPYEEVSLAYHAITSWVQEHGHEFAGPPREIYLNDPATVDPSEYMTEVQWPIR